MYWRNLFTVFSHYKNVLPILVGQESWDIMARATLDALIMILKYFWNGYNIHILNLLFMVQGRKNYRRLDQITTRLNYGFSEPVSRISESYQVNKGKWRQIKTKSSYTHCLYMYCLLSFFLLGINLAVVLYNIVLII